jgi:Flp pilus assembly protein TadG
MHLGKMPQSLQKDLNKEVTSMSFARRERWLSLRKLSCRDSGQSLLEFALAMPVVLLVVTGITAFGIAFNNYIILTEATAVAARQLTVSRGQTNDPCQTFSSAVYAAAPTLTSSNMTFAITLNGTSYTGTTCSGTATTGAPSNMVLGTNAVMTVTYPFTLSLYKLKLAPAGSVLTAKTTELMQ